jgi:hypothetical protein
MTNLPSTKNKLSPGILFLACGLAWIVIVVGLFFTPLGKPSYRAELAFKVDLLTNELRKEQIDASSLSGIDHQKLFKSERNISNVLRKERFAENVRSLAQFEDLDNTTIAQKIKASLIQGEVPANGVIVHYFHFCDHEDKSEESNTILMTLLASYKDILIEEENALRSNTVAEMDGDTTEPAFFKMTLLASDYGKQDNSGLQRILLIASLVSLFVIPALVFLKPNVLNGKRLSPLEPPSPAHGPELFFGPGQHEFGSRKMPSQSPTVPPDLTVSTDLTVPSNRGIGFLSTAVQLLLFAGLGVFISFIWNAYSTPIYQSSAQVRVFAKPELNLNSVEADSSVNSFCTFNIEASLKTHVSSMLDVEEELIYSLDQFKQYKSSPEEVTSFSVFNDDKRESLRLHLIENFHWHATTQNPGVVLVDFTSRNPEDSQLILARFCSRLKQTIEWNEQLDIEVLTPPDIGQKVSRNSIKSTIAFCSTAFLVGVAFILLRRYSFGARTSADSTINLHLHRNYSRRQASGLPFEAIPDAEASFANSSDSRLG